MNPLQKIKSQKHKPLQDKDLPYLHDLFMKEYGWIPITEFRELPMSTFWNLLSIIQERNERERAEYEKRNKKKGRL